MKKKEKRRKKVVSEGKVAYLKDLREQSFVEKSIQFLKEVKIEFKKITWPSRKHTLATTLAVLSFTLFIAFYLGMVDLILSKIVQWLVY